MSSGGRERVWAAFDLPENPRRRDEHRWRGCFTRPPGRVLTAGTAGEVAGCVTAAEAAALDGHWVVGGLHYEAGGAWDAAHQVRASAATLARFEVFDGEPLPWAPPVTERPALEWRDDDRFGADSSLTATAAIERVRDHIAAGDVYQVNLTTRLRTTFDRVDLYALFCGLAAAQPGGYAVFLRGGGVASVSPELFCQVLPGTPAVVRTQPMKGTAARPADPVAAAAAASQLVGSAKERAENLMIVDLLRNDLSRVCRAGTVRVEALFELLELPTVWQLTSTIAGEADAGTSLADVLGALFPCGSVTGAPKIRAMAVIHALEPEPRGWYCGALGVIRPGGAAVFNVPIRTVERSAGTLVCGVGSGIVADSDPEAERAEWRAKAEFLGGRPLAALETLLMVDGVTQRRRRHLERLAGTSDAFDLGVDLDEVARRLDAAERAHPSGRHRVRLTARGREVTVDVTDTPDTPLPVRLAVSRRSLDPSGELRRVIVHKTTHRAHYDALRRDAPEGVFDVICHTPDGRLTECTTGNLALRLDGQWLTPAASVGLLPGVLRAELLESGTLREAPLTIDDLARADEVAFVNGLRGWCPAEVVGQ